MRCESSEDSALAQVCGCFLTLRLPATLVARLSLAHRVSHKVGPSPIGINSTSLLVPLRPAVEWEPWDLLNTSGSAEYFDVVNMFLFYCIIDTSSRDSVFLFQVRRH